MICLLPLYVNMTVNQAFLLASGQSQQTSGGEGLFVLSHAYRYGSKALNICAAASNLKASSMSVHKRVWKFYRDHPGVGLL